MVSLKRLGIRWSCVALALASASPSFARETLEQALVQAYLTNPLLLAERARQKATDETVAKAIALWRPTLTIAASASRVEIDSEIKRTPLPRQVRDPWEASVTLKQTVFSSGRILAQRLGAGAEVRAGRARLHATEQEVLLQTVTAYMDVVRDREVLGLNQSNIRVLLEELQEARVRYELGDITLTDLARAEARLAFAEAELVGAEAQLKSRILAFTRIVGEAPGDLDPTPPLPHHLQEAYFSEASLRQRSLRQAPGLLAARENEDIALHRMNLSVAALGPEISIEAAYRRSNNDDLAPSKNGEETAIMLVFRLPLYQGGTEWSAIRQSEEQLNVARMEAYQAKGETLRLASNSWEQLRSRQAELAANIEVERAQAIALAGVQKESSYRQRTTLDVLNAQQEHLDAQVSVVRSRRDLVVAAHAALASAGDLTAETLALPVPHYDPLDNYDSNVTRWAGLSEVINDPDEIQQIHASVLDGREPGLHEARTLSSNPSVIVDLRALD